MLAERLRDDLTAAMKRHDELATSDDESAERSTGGGILVSVTYLVMMVGAAALPFLVLL